MRASLVQYWAKITKICSSKNKLNSQKIAKLKQKKLATRYLVKDLKYREIRDYKEIERSKRSEISEVEQKPIRPGKLKSEPLREDQLKKREKHDKCKRKDK